MPRQTKYKTILADPPWDFYGRGTYGPGRKYSLMPLDRIKVMPVKDLADENSHCWLWCTAASLRYGYDVLESWGYTPRSIFTWVKPRFTLGVYLRNATEFMLFGTRGKAPVQFKGQGSWGFYPLQKHSQKPEEQYAVIERVSPGPYLELFARRKQPGWSAWGDGVKSDITIKGFPVPTTKKVGDDEK